MMKCVKKNDRITQEHFKTCTYRTNYRKKSRNVIVILRLVKKKNETQKLIYCMRMNRNYGVKSLIITRKKNEKKKNKRINKIRAQNMCVSSKFLCVNTHIPHVQFNNVYCKLFVRCKCLFIKE